MAKVAQAVLESPDFGNNLQGFPKDTYDLPNELMLDSTASPTLDGLGGGTAAYRGNKSEQFQQDDPGYAGGYQLQFANPQAYRPTQARQAPAPGSVDLDAPRDSGPDIMIGSQRLINSEGPVTGESSNHNWSNTRHVLPQFSADYDGPVSGGPDSGQKIAAAYYASQLQEYSAMANAQALLAAI
jgi:hypothetical protein